MKRYIILFILFQLLVPQRVFAQNASPLAPILSEVVSELAVGANALDAIAKRISSRMNKMSFSDVQSSIIGSQFERMVKELTDVKKDVNALNGDMETFRSRIPSPEKYIQFKETVSNAYRNTVSVLASQKRLIAELQQIQTSASSSSSASPSGTPTKKP